MTAVILAHIWAFASASSPRNGKRLEKSHATKVPSGAKAYPTINIMTTINSPRVSSADE